MRTGRVAVGAVWVGAMIACAQGDSLRTPRRVEEVSPRLIVSIDSVRERGLLFDSLRLIPDLPVQFPALVTPDRNHVTPIVAVGHVAVERLRDVGSVREGDTLALVRSPPDNSGVSSPILAQAEGMWVPKPRLEEDAWPGDTLGQLEDPNHSLAIGTLYADEAETIHPTDPALVHVAGNGHGRFEGRVEWVRHAGGDPREAAEIAVDFINLHHAASVGPAADVTVTPTGPGDSALAAPGSAIARLTTGLAVFIPQGSGRYEVRFVFTGPRVGSLIVLRSGADHGTAVVSWGHQVLERAAEDSIAARAGRQR